MDRGGAADDLLSELWLGQSKGSGMGCRGQGHRGKACLPFFASC